MIQEYTNYTNLFRLDEAAIKNLEERANEGDAEALFALGRYHYCTNNRQDAMTLAEGYLLKAQAQGVAEADVALAIMYRRGATGSVDKNKAKMILQNAAQKGCKYAIETLIMDMIYGMNGKPVNIHKAMEWLEKLMKEEEYPVWDYLMGCASQQSNDVAAAKRWLENAVERGITEAYSDLAYTLLDYTDDAAANRKAYITTLQRGATEGDGVSTMLLALSRVERYEEAGTYERMLLGQELLLNLERATKQGCGSAAYYLGCVYAEGSYGIAQDYGKAWRCFVRGSELRSNDCYEVMYDMIENRLTKDCSISPDMCALNGARYGSERLAAVVVEIYRQGGLTEYAGEIEQYYMTNL